jgi:hypothetical protein
MRTKILLLTAALGAASLATSMAQVYSVNMVGYVNLTLIPGASFIANQLKQSPNNSVETIFASVPGSQLDGFITVSKYNGVGFDSVAYDGEWLIVAGSQTAAQMACAPGEAFFIDNASLANYTLTLVGEVATGSYAVNIPLGLGAYASPIPAAGLLETQLGFPVDSVMSVTFLDLTANPRTFTDLYQYDGGWIPSEPNVPVGMGFFVDNGSPSAKSWNRNFSVGP